MCNKLYGSTVKFILENFQNPLVSFNQVFKICTKLSIFTFSNVKLNNELITDPAKKNREQLKMNYLATLKNADNIK